MSEGIVLPHVPRGTLLPERERLARLAEATPQILAAVAGETDGVSVQATLACLLWETLPHASWCGFYRRVEDQLLSVGPYQGGMGCLRIPFSKGVCGACAREARPMLVPDVRRFPGHIACDDATLSELVLPVMGKQRLEAVLDLDARELDAFCQGESDALTTLLSQAFADVVRW